jgi:hypothetical protein
MSCQRCRETLLPNHWWASSWATFDSARVERSYVTSSCVSNAASKVVSSSTVPPKAEKG